MRDRSLSRSNPKLKNQIKKITLNYSRKRSLRVSITRIDNHGDNVSPFLNPLELLEKGGKRKETEPSLY